MSNSLWPRGLQHARLPCPSLSPRVCSSNSCPLSQWCYLAILPSAVPFSFCLQSFPVSRPFPISQFFVLGSQSIRASASASVLLVNVQGWFPLGLTGLSALLSKDSQGSSPKNTIGVFRELKLFKPSRWLQHLTTIKTRATYPRFLTLVLLRI